jgi:hypothetical protein
MRIVFLIIALLIGVFSFSQDPDFPDMRNKRESFVKIQDKAVRSDISCFAMAGLDEATGKQPLRALPLIAVSNDSIAFEGNGISVKIKAGIFDASKHKLGYYTNTDNNKKYLTKIDGKPFYGDYGRMPNTTIESLTVLLGDDTVAIPKEAYADLYNPIFRYNENGIEKYINNVYLSADGRTIYIYMLKREAGGSYEVTWVIQNKQYVRRVVDYGFLRN